MASAQPDPDGRFSCLSHHDRVQAVLQRDLPFRRSRRIQRPEELHHRGHRAGVRQRYGQHGNLGRFRRRHLDPAGLYRRPGPEHGFPRAEDRPLHRRVPLGCDAGRPGLHVEIHHQYRVRRPEQYPVEHRHHQPGGQLAPGLRGRLHLGVRHRDLRHGALRDVLRPGRPAVHRPELL